MSWTCPQFESALSDYREGALPAAAAAEARRHATECAACGELLAAVSAAQQQLAGLPSLPPSERLLASLLALGPRASARHAPAVRRPGAGLWRNLWATCTSPRFAMGVAMSVFAVALLLNAAQINLRQVFSPGGLDQLSPASLTSNLQRRFDRAWARGVSYYHDLRVVYEIEAAVHQMRQQTPAAAPAPPSGGHTERVPPRRADQLLADNFAPAPPGRAATGSPRPGELSGTRGRAALGPAPLDDWSHR